MVRYSDLHEKTCFRFEKKIYFKLNNKEAFSVSDNDIIVFEINPEVKVLSIFDLKKALKRNLIYVEAWKEEVYKHALRKKRVTE